MVSESDEFIVKPTLRQRVGLQGYVQSDDGEQVWLKSAEGTWIVNKSDIVGETEWTGVRDARFSGRPATVYVRGDAEIYEIRTVKLKALREWPLAIAPQARASAQLPCDLKMPAVLRDEVVLEAGDAGAPPPPTRSLKPDTTGWGSVYGRDD